MRLLITGASGFLGSHLVQRAQTTNPTCDLYATHFSHFPDFHNFPQFQPIPSSSLDLRDTTRVLPFITDLKPDIILHTAALMGKDGLEPPTARGEAWDMNVEGTRNIAQAAKQIHARLVHVSTDVIFDGEHAPYDEGAPPYPIHRYGVSKAEAERVVRDSGANAVIVRTSLIYGFAPFDPRTRAMLEGRMPNLFTDEYRNPIWVMTLADALLELSTLDYRGILNIAGAQRLNRYEFGVKLARALGGDPNLFVPTLRATSSLIRPRDCTLDISRAQRLLQTKLLGVEDVIREMAKNI